MNRLLGCILSFIFCSISFSDEVSAGNCKLNKNSIKFCSDKVVCEWQYWAMGGKYESLRTWPDERQFAILEAHNRGLRCAAPLKEKISKLLLGFNELSFSDRRKIQRNLKKLGFYTGKIDAILGAKTKNALIQYNKKHRNGADLNIIHNVNLLLDSLRGSTIAKTTSKKYSEAPTVKKDPEVKKTPKVTETPKPKQAQSQNLDKTYKVASGTGFYVSKNGHIITNHHVIDGCKEMKVQSKGRIYNTLRIADDRKNDLALLKISHTPKYVFSISETSPYSLQEIIVAGFPFGDRISSTLKFTQGIVSAIAGLENDYSQIQIDAALQPGNSGGPIMDEFGNIIGVAVAKLSLEKIMKDYGVVPENTNFGVKASAVKNLMEGNGINFKEPNNTVLPKKVLSQIATDGTVYLTCWMTKIQIDQMKTKKLMFNSLE